MRRTALLQGRPLGARPGAVGGLRRHGAGDGPVLPGGREGRPRLRLQHPGEIPVLAAEQRHGHRHHPDRPRPQRRDDRGRERDGRWTSTSSSTTCRPTSGRRRSRPSPPTSRPTSSASASTPTPARKSNKDEATGIKSSDSGVGVDVKRTYFTFTHQFDSRWSAVVPVRHRRPGRPALRRLRQEGLRRRPRSPRMATFRLGSADTPWIPYVEGVYGLRYVEQTITDHLSFGASAEWGLHVTGIEPALGLPALRRQRPRLQQPHPQQDASTSRAGVSFTPVKGLNLAVGGYSGKRGLETDAAPAKHTATRSDALVAYNTDLLQGRRRVLPGQELEQRHHGRHRQVRRLLRLGAVQPQPEVGRLRPLRQRQPQQGPQAEPRVHLLQRRAPVDAQQGLRRLAGLQVRRGQGRHAGHRQRHHRLDQRQVEGQVQRDRHLHGLQLLRTGLTSLYEGAARAAPASSFGLQIFTLRNAIHENGGLP